MKENTDSKRFRTPEIRYYYVLLTSMFEIFGW